MDRREKDGYVDWVAEERMQTAFLMVDEVLDGQSAHGWYIVRGFQRDGRDIVLTVFSFN